MLVAIADRTLAGTTVRSVSVLEREFRGYITTRRGLAFDTRFAARAGGSAEACGHVYIMVDGTLSTSTGLVAAAPAAFVLADTELERVHPRRSITFRTDGPRVALIQLRIPSKHVRAPIGLAHGPLGLGPRAVAGAERIITDAEAGVIGPESFRELLDELGASGIIAPELAATIVDPEPERFERLWTAIRPLYAGFEMAPSFKGIAASLDMSKRQLTRVATDAARTFNLPARTFKDVAVLLRLRAAVMLLSAHEASIAEIAETIGYGSTTAMDRAFRNAKLPPPREVRRAMLPVDRIDG